MKNRHIEKHAQRGAIMTEVLAAIALLGIMGTMLFQQIYNRYQDLQNIQMASEMRLIREGFTTYIQSSRTDVELACHNVRLTDINPTRCDVGSDDLAGFILDYLPATMDNVVDDYIYGLYAYSLVDGKGPLQFFGVMMPIGDNLPSKWGIKRAARIANLVGADGGIYNRGDTEVAGVNGAWHLEVDNTFSDALKNNSVTYAAITSMEVYAPDPEDAQISLQKAPPDNVAFGRLHAWNYFSVGAAGAPGVQCFSLGRDPASRVWASDAGDTIYSPGKSVDASGGNNCDPLFWVWTGNASENLDGHVYARNNLYTGIVRAPGGEIQSKTFGLETDKDDNTKRRLVLYDKDTNFITDPDAKPAVVIDATGRMQLGHISGDAYVIDLNAEDKTAKIGSVEIRGNDNPEIKLSSLLESDHAMTISDGKIAINKKPGTLSEVDDPDETYMIDPAHTSLMKDIRLGSRGGARLSEILPNYIARDMGVGACEFNGQTCFLGNAGNNPGIGKPTDCPADYGRALIVIPFGGAGYSGIPGTTYNFSHTHENVSDPALNNVTLRSCVLNVEVTRSSNTGSINEFNHGNTDEEWEVAFSYKDGSVTCDPPRDANGGYTPLNYWWQTYCVYDENEVDSDTSADPERSGANYCNRMGYQYSNGCTTNKLSVLDVNGLTDNDVKKDACRSISAVWDDEAKICSERGNLE